MVGFPGEGDEEFAELADFVSEGWFDKLGVFIYSPEAGTKAANYPAQIPLETAEFRQETIMEIQREISQNKNEAKVGRELSVLIDEKLKEGYFGRTVYDAPEVDGGVIIRGKAKVGDMVKVKITEADEYDLRGIVIA
jgi:ribosomal protein S12 methylthiotransferase